MFRPLCLHASVCISFMQLWCQQSRSKLKTLPLRLTDPKQHTSVSLHNINNKRLIRPQSIIYFKPRQSASWYQVWLSLTLRRVAVQLRKHVGLIIAAGLSETMYGKSINLTAQMNAGGEGRGERCWDKRDMTEWRDGGGWWWGYKASGGHAAGLPFWLMALASLRRPITWRRCITVVCLPWHTCMHSAMSPIL